MLHLRHIPFSRKVKHSGAKNGPGALRKTQSGGLSALLCLRLHASRLKIARAQVCRSFVLLCLLDGLQKVLRAGVTHRRFERTDLHEGSPRNLCDCFRAGRLALPQRALFLDLLLLVRQAPLLHGRMETSVAVSTARSAAFRQPTAGGQIARKTSAAVFRFGPRSVARLLQLRALHDLLPLRHQRVRLLPLPLRPTLRERQDHRLHPHSLSCEGIGQELRRPIHQRPLRVARVSLASCSPPPCWRGLRYGTSPRASRPRCVTFRASSENWGRVKKWLDLGDLVPPPARPARTGP